MLRPILIASICALSATLPSFAADTTPPKRPNVLYVIADMERAFSMGCYGDKNAKTPAFDRFGDE